MARRKSTKEPTALERLIAKSDAPATKRISTALPLGCLPMGVADMGSAPDNALDRIIDIQISREIATHRKPSKTTTMEAQKRRARRRTATQQGDDARYAETLQGRLREMETAFKKVTKAIDAVESAAKRLRTTTQDARINEWRSRVGIGQSADSIWADILDECGDRLLRSIDSVRETTKGYPPSFAQLRSHIDSLGGFDGAVFVNLLLGRGKSSNRQVAYPHLFILAAAMRDHLGLDRDEAWKRVLEVDGRLPGVPNAKKIQVTPLTALEFREHLWKKYWAMRTRFGAARND